MRRSVSKKDTEGLREYRPNFLLRWMYRKFFSHTDLEERSRSMVRGAAERGTVVYVMRSLSFLDFFSLDSLVRRYSLPLIRFVNDLGLWILEPFGRGGRRLRLRRQVPEQQALRQTIQDRFSALLFLRRPPRLGQRTDRGRKLDVDLLRTLVELQREQQRPIFLIPQTIVWGKLASRRRFGGVIDLLLGPSEWPGKVRSVLQFLLNYKRAVLRSADPFDLSEFLREHPDLPDNEVADRVRYVLLRIMERERQIVLGPTKKSPARIREELMRSPRLQALISEEAQRSGRPLAKVQREAVRELRRMAANQDPAAMVLLDGMLDRLWNRIYDGIEVDEEGMQRVREVARDAALVFLPCHKSHIDYLVLNHTLYRNSFSPPLSAAGDNMNFWPVGTMLRRGGGFFIRRSFRQKPLYRALVDAYMRKILVEGFHMEFFVEGGRSRTGKLLSPKYGMLSMVVDAALKLTSKPIVIVPVALGYERIIESKSYAREAEGEEKPRENIGQLLRTPRILRSKYGRLYVNFGEFISFDDILATTRQRRGLPAPQQRPEELSDQEHRYLVQRLAHTTLHRINQVSVVAPVALVALVILGHRRRGMEHGALIAQAEQLLEQLRAKRARFANSLEGKSPLMRREAYDAAIDLLVDSKLLVEHGGDGKGIYMAPPERRVALEYYKNGLIHFFVQESLVMTALFSLDGTASVEELQGRVRDLSRLFKYEFVFPVQATFTETFEAACAQLVKQGAVVQQEGQLLFASPEGSLGGASPGMAGFYLEILRTYMESYRLAHGGLALLRGQAMAKKDWVRRVLAQGNKDYLSGEIQLKESISKIRLDTALRAFEDLGMVRATPKGDLVLGDAPTTEQMSAAMLLNWSGWAVEATAH